MTAGFAVLGMHCQPRRPKFGVGQKTSLRLSRIGATRVYRDRAWALGPNIHGVPPHLRGRDRIGARNQKGTSENMRSAKHGVCDTTEELLRPWRRRGRWAGAAAAVGALALAGCVGDDDAGPEVPTPVAAASQAETAAGGLMIQLLDKPDIAGNARVTLRNDPPPGGKAPPYLVVGQTENPIILRDDGIGADVKAGDAVYSGFANVDQTALAVRSRNESAQISQFKIESVPTFSGRTMSGNVAPVAFDINSFSKGIAVAFDPSIIFAPVSPAANKSLLINDPNVVGAVGDPSRVWDPCTGAGTKMGAFTFGKLMTEMANQPLTGINPSNFVMQWLQTWQATQTINTFNVPARPNIATQIINPWLAASGGVSLDLGIAPFRLLAIVNRLDLRTGSSTYGGSTGNAGELRFVFGLVKPGRTCQLLPMTVILEYGVPIQGCLPVKSWAQQWINLNSLALGSAAYNTALQAITDQVVLRNKAPSKPNGSALNQLRTNEIAIGNPWELRQFNLRSPIDFLHETPVAQTPDRRFNAFDPGWSGSTLLDTYIMLTPIGATVPLSFAGNPFLGGAAPVTNNNLSYFWKTTTLDLDPTHSPNWNDNRFQFSLNTCNACHAGETRTSFTHINPTTPLGSPAALSGFLTGITVTDPAFGAPTRSFNDLARRQSDLVGVASAGCVRFPRIEPEFVKMAFEGDPLPDVLVSQPVAPVSEQGAFLVEDFFKAPIQTH